MTTTLPDVYFGRVDPRWNASTREHHWKNRTFGVMFDNDGSIEPDDLARARAQKAAGEKEWSKAAGYSDRYGIEALERLIVRWCSWTSGAERATPS